MPLLVPAGFTVFYTTIDYRGDLALDAGIALRSLVPGLRIAHCHQVHGPDVHYVSADGREAAGDPMCDALWTDQNDVALAIKVADCLPVSLIDPRGVIANIHSGWRGAVQNITAATVDAAPLDRAQTIAFLGPSIRVCCFEVGEEVAAQFDARFVDRERGPKPHVDIAAFTANVLRGRGIEQIVDTNLCTRCAGSIFHSYRREKGSGRNLAIVASS